MTKPVAEVTTQFLSVDCLIDQRESSRYDLSRVDTISRVFYQKLIILSLSPFLVVIASTAVWMMIFKVSEIRSARAAINNSNENTLDQVNPAQNQSYMESQGQDY